MHDSAQSSSPWAGLEVAKTGRMKDDERGGVAVVLLHGWGAPGDDLVPLAQALARPRSRFFMPAGPLVAPGGGRAWWHLDLSDRPVHAWDDQVPPDHRPHAQVKAARTAIQTILRTIRERHAPDTLIVGGFSQGAMLSIDVALAADPPVDRVAALSGVMLADSLPGLHAPRAAHPAVLVTHGREDQLLPFEAGERAAQMLERHHFPVTWRPFDGGHDIPAAIVEELRGFLFPHAAAAR